MALIQGQNRNRSQKLFKMNHAASIIVDLLRPIIISKFFSSATLTNANK